MKKSSNFGGYPARALRAGPKGLRAESARAVTGLADGAPTV